MKLGVLTVALGDMSLDAACKFLSEQGVQMVEIGCGGFPGTAHCNAAELLADENKQKEFLDTIHKYGLEISALSAHGNAVHPDKAIAKKFDEDLTNAILLAEKLGVPVVNTFSGCPGGSPEDKTPNWVTCPWPDDFSEILEYQWNDVLIPYWKEKVAFAKAHNVHKIALELHPGFCVYNTRSLLKLREAVGPEIGANLDPSHLIWQGMDLIAVIRELGKANAIFHFHAKDTKVDAINTAVNGVLDTQHYSEELTRSWIFRSVGYGHGEDYWKAIASELRLAGYDYAISIERREPGSQPPDLAGNGFDRSNQRAWQGKCDFPFPCKRHQSGCNQHCSKRRTGYSALQRRTDPFLDLPLCWLRSWRRLLESDRFRTSSCRL